MAVPKKRTGRSAQAKRRANWKATVPATTTCKNCGSIVLTHTVCAECGTYKNKVVSIKGQTADTTAEVKKADSKVVETEAKPVDDAEVKAEAKTESESTESEEKPKRTRKPKKADTEEK